MAKDMPINDKDIDPTYDYLIAKIETRNAKTREKDKRRDCKGKQ